MLAEGGARVLDACAAVLSWGMPGHPVDGGGGRWSPLKVRRIHEHCAAWARVIDFHPVSLSAIKILHAQLPGIAGHDFLTVTITTLQHGMHSLSA